MRIMRTLPVPPPLVSNRVFDYAAGLRASFQPVGFACTITSMGTYLSELATALHEWTLEKRIEMASGQLAYDKLSEI